MTVAESLFKAVTLLGLGMTFVFLFLGLLMIAVKLMAKYVPADQPVNSRGTTRRKVALIKSETNPQLIAAVTTAVQQYRKTKTA